MTITTVHGVYSNGTIRLLENPSGITEGPVLVTLSSADAPSTAEPRYLQYGKYACLPGHASTEDDFKEAEWNGPADF